MNHNWRKTPARLYIGCVAAALFDAGHQGLHEFIGCVNVIMPGWKREFMFDGEITDRMLWQRGDKAMRYETERPWNNPLKKPFWEQAKRDVAAMKSSFDFEDRKMHLESVSQRSMPQTAENVYLYLYGDKLKRERVAVGITNNPPGRLMAHVKGGLGDLERVTLLLIEGAHKIETRFKREHKWRALGHEIFYMSPQSALEALLLIIEQEGVMWRYVREEEFA